MEDWDGIARLIGFSEEKAMLTSFYVDEQLGLKDIASKLNCGMATVALRLEKHKIPRRGRGGANNSHRVTKALFRLDQRQVFSLPDQQVANLLHCHPSTVYKYKRGVTSTGIRRTTV